VHTWPAATDFWYTGVGETEEVAEVAFERVTKVFNDGTQAVSGLNLEVRDGEFVVLVGPSGCGKTTALRMVAGLEGVTEGEIRIGGKVVNEIEARRRDVAMVFQNYALYPHMTVFDNIAFGLRMRSVRHSERRRRVEDAARILGIGELLDRRPKQLSGGQRQRVAMGRAIVRSPKAFLMDEPLSNLDAMLRVQMRAEVARIQHELQATTIYVTHDQIEAMTMGERVAVLRRGVLQQVDDPQRLYETPVNLFVASFIGSPSMNLLQGRIERANGDILLELGEERLPLADRRELLAYVGREVGVGVRPEHVPEPQGASPGWRLRGVAKATELLGSELLCHLEVPCRPLVTTELVELAEDVDRAAADELRQDAADRRATIVCRFEAESRVRAGAVAECALDPARLHFFDVDTGRAIGAA
jgi:multiple sugar transport system ATP-binding protein